MSTLDRASMVAQLRANRERILKDKTLTLPLPGWVTLTVRYRRLPWESVKGLAGLGDAADSTQEVAAAMDVLLDACDEVLFDGEGLGLRYEQGLAQLIGDEESATPPEVLMSVFGEDDAALMIHAGEFMQWAMRLEAEASATLGKG